MSIADAHADLFLADEAEPQRAAAAIGQGESTGVAFIELRHDALAEYGRMPFSLASTSNSPPPRARIKRMGMFSETGTPAFFIMTSIM